MFVATILQSYVVEEWIHYAVHFHHFRGRYFRYIRRHHLYHHGARGGHVAFGLSSGVWDVPLGTRIPSKDRTSSISRFRRCVSEGATSGHCATRSCPRSAGRSAASLLETRWNKVMAAKRLGLTRTQLYGRLRKYDIDRPAAR